MHLENNYRYMRVGEGETCVRIEDIRWFCLEKVSDTRYDVYAALFGKDVPYEPKKCMKTSMDDFCSLCFRFGWSVARVCNISFNPDYFVSKRYSGMDVSSYVRGEAYKDYKAIVETVRLCKDRDFLESGRKF